MRKAVLIGVLLLVGCAPQTELVYDVVQTRADARPAAEAGAKCRLVAAQYAQQDQMINAMTPPPTDFASRYIAADAASRPSRAQQAFDDCLLLEGYVLVPREVSKAN